MFKLNIVVSLLLFNTLLVAAEDPLRFGSPKDCFLFSWGKGPNWTTKVSVEFRESLLNTQKPYIDDQYSEPTDKALTWVPSDEKPKIFQIATVDGRKIIQIVYPTEGSFGRDIGTILLAIETKHNSEWFSPFFAAQPELYKGNFVSGKDIPFGYIVTLEYSGTGAYRTHHLFDLRQSHPRIIKTLNAGRVVRYEFDSDSAYEAALKNFDTEEALLSGIIPKAKSIKK